MAGHPLHQLGLQSHGVADYWRIRPQIGISGMGAGKALYGDGSHIPQESFLHEGLLVPPTSRP